MTSSPCCDTMAASGQGQSYRRSRFLRQFGTLLTIGPIIIVFSCLAPGFLSANSLRVVAQQMSVMGLVAASVTVALRSGGTDLSAGMLAGLSGVLFAGFSRFMPAWLAMIATLLIGLCFGTLTGVFVAYVGIASLITTLAMRCVQEGIMFAYTRSRVIMVDLPQALVWLGRGRLWGMPVLLLVTVAVYLLLHVFFRHTRPGRYITAIGGGREAAMLMGINVRHYECLAYVLAGIISALAGTMLTLRSNLGAPGETFLLDGLAAAYIGTTMFGGGEPNIPGTMVGVVVITLIAHGLNMLGFSLSSQTISKGLVFIGCVALSSVHRKSK